DSVPKSRFQIQGIFIEQDAANYLRFDLYHDGTSLKLHAATILNGTAANVFEAPIAAPNSGPLYLRVARSGDQWTQAYSTDGAGWSTGANFTQPLIVTNVGPFAGNAGSNAPAFTGIVDYFFNSAAPILPEDSNIVGPNLTLTGNGTVTRAPVQSNYYCGQTVTLSAAPATGWRFAGWSGALTGIQNPTALTATVSQAITATFVKESYLLRLDTIGEGQVAVQPIMVAYPFNTIVTVTATPKADWVFAGWEGDHEGSTNPIQITMDRAKAITAIFTTKMVTASYTVSTVVSGEGTLTRSPDAPSYTGGATVTLTATAASGWLFDGWQGLAGTSNPATIIVTRNRVITATFIPLRHVITTAVVGNGAVTRAPDAADYPHGTIVTVTANAAPGWRFAGWQGDGTGIEPSLTLTVDQDLHLTATFVEALPDSYTLLTNVGEGGAITLSPALASYPAGATVTITAVPTTGWVFTGWSGDLTSLENPLTVTMDRAYAIQATFAPMMVTF
ncbi:MAG: InlB B-repeat-containing protein, partial [Caldilineaceae bacterium]|nr:InlB B-repeat-containing protein [Caldilineaceae bacterium]